MTTSVRLAPTILAATILLDLAAAAPSLAQDSMQLDTMFRESLSQGRDQARGEEEKRRVQGHRHEARDADQRQDARRSLQRRNDEGR
jgi:hypothetical protein